MRAARGRGQPIDLKRRRSWRERFEGYRTPVTTARIDSWLSLFDSSDRDLAARVLDSVEFFSQEQLGAAFRHTLQGLNGWHRDEAKRKGRWCFVAFSPSAGKSGDQMISRFRHANELDRKGHDKLFAGTSDLFRLGLQPGDTVVFIDDMSASGRQVCEYWEELRERIPSGLNLYLLLVAASAEARSEIQSRTDLIVASHTELTSADNVFSVDCQNFDSAEQLRLLRYCKRADRRRPKGFEDSGLVVVFAHRCPNNSIPILHQEHLSWEGLFPRHG